MSVMPLASQSPVQQRHLTYDWTNPPATPPSEDLKEVWVDVKTPGDGFVYTLGTVFVHTTGDPGNPQVTVQFSQADATPSFDLLAFSPLSNNAVKQVVILQKSRADDNSIVWQKFYYGKPEDSQRPANARGLSVWPAWDPVTHAPDEANTRIAICGESYKSGLPLDQRDKDPQNPAFYVTSWKGFIGVFNGSGDLQWSHIFSAEEQSGLTGQTAITDVSIRVEEPGTANARDVVTYCGVSSCGVPSTPTPISMMPMEAFAPPSPIATCTPAGGSTNNGAGQWDGIVGRLTNSHANPWTWNSFGHRQSNAQTLFHSVVGSALQDGLFGIDEIDADRFVVVGSTGQWTGMPVSTTGTLSFPFLPRLCLSPATVDYAMGVVLVFRFPPGSPSQALELQFSSPIGLGPRPAQIATCHPSGLTRTTVARDVVVQRRWLPLADIAMSQNLIVVVGSTNECDLWTELGAVPTGQGTIGGNTDGFVLGLIDSPTVGTFTFDWGSFRGGAGEDGITGVQSWNEFADHAGVVGFVDGTLQQDGYGDFRLIGADITTGSYWVNTSYGYPPKVVQLRSVRLGTTNNPMAQPPVPGAYIPTAVGLHVATRPAPVGTYHGQLFFTFGLGDPGGGGIAIDPTARFQVVGARVGSGLYPNTGGGRATQGNDGVRAVLDMLPDHVGRTDGTGVPVPAPGQQYPLPGYFGGTTPECALSPLGRRIGDPLPSLTRMLIDYEGPDPGVGVSPAVVVVRPPEDAFGSVGVLQIGFPGLVPQSNPLQFYPIDLYGTGTLLWMTSSPVQIPTPGPASLQRSVRFPLGGLPPLSPVTLSMQYFCLLVNPVPGGAQGPVCPNPQGATTVASPAIWIRY